VRNFGFIPIIYSFPTVPEWFPWLNEGEGGLAINNNFRWYWTILPITALSLLFMSNVIRTSEGRAFAAVKARDTASSLVGVSPVKSKLLVFMVSSAFVSMSGALQSYFLSAREEASYPFQTTLDIVFVLVRSPDGLSGAWKRVKSYFAKWPYSL